MSSSELSVSNPKVVHQRCEYCTNPIISDNDDYLKCQLCQANVHIRCLRHASTPGDLLGDVFFDLTCSNCNDDALLQFDGPSTSSSSTAPREKLVRQRLPWLMVITLTLYNLSLKSKGLSNHGYFHWRTHIVSFIDKNWDYLFDPTVRRRKKWIGSVSGALSHNSPEFFLSGQEVFQESGWWKLTHSNRTPKFIFKLYEQQSLKRQQMRNDKRSLEGISSSLPETIPSEVETKRVRRVNSEEDLPAITDSCSRTIPYMGRKPKVIKSHKIADSDKSKFLKKEIQEQQQEEEQQPLNTVQSSLMDFLAENLASDDLIFQDLPNIAAEPISLGKQDDFLQLIDGDNNTLISPIKNAENTFFDVPSIKGENNSSNGYNLSEPAKTEDVESKLKSFYLFQEQPQGLDEKNVPLQDFLQGSVNDSSCTSANVNDLNEFDNVVENEDGSDDDEYKPRIIQVTNYQQTQVTESKISPKKTVKKIKTELKSDVELSDSDVRKQKIGELSESLNDSATQEADDAEDGEVSDSSSPEEKGSTLPPCKPSLFTKRKQQREWPWLADYRNQEPDEENTTLTAEDKSTISNENIAMMSEYEEEELLQKLRRIFSLETQLKIEIPSYVRRFYRKLCVRAWKREHSKPLFNIDDYLDPSKKAAAAQDSNSKTQLIDRYQLLSVSAADARTSFYARIAGSLQHELFESPYTQRVLHPFIYRSSKCFPPWLKLMCELQYSVNGTIPKRAPIDYCYVRPNHIAAVNALLQTVFWPGIDMTECLSYPDFSVVAMYKKLVIGCGFLVPDVGYNEAYISFMAVRPGWQRSGIATFMLYHLIQTCMSKDITLHVSATNPAVVLYQKFGFKIEEVILDFYEKYLPLHSKHSRHALFLRLLR